MNALPNTADKPFASIWSDLQGVPFEQAYVDAAGVRTRYLHAGTKGRPALIFIHGTGGHAEAYVRNLAAHGEHFDVYALDLLGHGFTAKPDKPYLIPDYLAQLVGFMDALGLDKASLSGESLGGWVAAHFAVQHPQRVSKLVLNTASGDKVNREALARLREMSIAAVEDPSYERIKARLEWLMHDKSHVNDDLVKSRQAIYAQPSMKKAIHSILALHTPEARERWAITPEQWRGLDRPTLVLWTDHDPTATVEVGQQLADAIPGSKFVVMTGCGHWPQYEDAAEFNRLQIEFLRDG
ncbi:MAG TPA: alpha/beta fold hydrolase [Caldimonas sp.]|jgi:2-hydroxy-6-oxonona-2,4-dienedioate hydrolase|nr:alpha/beta fold hydrolase [Caldimonas sp.]HEX2540357.1 alpha/beta fold hydrolase [Caldimonas sp.]